jgi:aliphatic sulfonates family ABC transporter substrate-binding protein
VIVGVRRGIYEDAGLDIETQIVTGGIQSAEALISGQADVAALGDAPGIICLSRSPKVKLLSLLGDGERMHRLVVRDAAGITSAKDLGGKRLAVQHGSSTHGGVLLYLKEHGVDPADVNFVSLSPRDFPEAMNAEQIDAAAGSAPWPQNVMESCDDCSILANLEGLGNTYPLLLVAREEFVQDHPDAARELVKATQAAGEWITSHPDEAADVIAAGSGIGPEREREMLEDYRWRTEITAETLDSLRMTADFLRDQGRIDDVPDFDRRLALEGMGIEGDGS